MPSLTILNKCCFEGASTISKESRVEDELPLEKRNKASFTQRRDDIVSAHSNMGQHADGMKAALKKIEPDGLDDLGAINALYRPGPMKYIDNYINRKHGKEKFEYIHPDLEPILKNTYAIIVFQESLIEIGRLASMRNPDSIRIACGKKKPEVMAQVEPELRHGLYGRGWSKDQVDKLWSDMIEFASYAFNKAHK